MCAEKSNTAYYLCMRCGHCCRWPGVVRLHDDEIETLAHHLHLNAHEFTARYTRLTRDRKALALTEQPDGACVFLAGNACRIQTVKPRQCRAFPNGWRFDGFERQCQARRIPAGVAPGTTD